MIEYIIYIIYIIGGIEIIYLLIGIGVSVYGEYKHGIPMSIFFILWIIAPFIMVYNRVSTRV